MAGLKRYPDGRGGFVRLSDTDAKRRGFSPANGLVDRASTAVPAPVPETYEGPPAEGVVVDPAVPKGALTPSGPTQRARKAAADAELAEARRLEERAERERLILERYPEATDDEISSLAALSDDELGRLEVLHDPSSASTLAAIVAETSAHLTEETTVSDPATPAEPAPAPDVPAGVDPAPADKAREAPSGRGRRRRAAED